MAYSQSQYSSATNTLPASAKAIATITVLAGVAAVALAARNTGNIDWLRLSTFTVIGIAAAMLKVKLPGMNSTMSVNLPFILLSAAELSLAGVLIVACVSTTVQSLWHTSSSFKPVRVAFNLSSIGIAAELAWFVFHYSAQGNSSAVAAIGLSCGAAAYFLANTITVAAVVAAAERKSFGKTWASIFMLTFPYYVLSSGLAVSAISISRFTGWQGSVVLLVVMFGVYSSFKLHFGQQKAFAKDRQNALAAEAHV